MQSLIRIITTLQAENIQVLESKAELLDQSETAGQGSVKEASFDDFQSHFKSNKNSLKRVMHLLKESETAAPYVADESLQKLFEFSKGEISHAYDSLISGLEKRENLIEQRIEEQLKHFGMEERILFDQKDFSVELEDIQSSNLFAGLKPE